MANELSQSKSQPAYINRPIIAEARNYSRKEAALAIGCSVITLIRAYDAGHLQAYRVGRRVLHSGKHIMDWLQKGGRTTSMHGGSK